MKHDNRSKSTRTNKNSAVLIEALKSQDVKITNNPEDSAVNMVITGKNMTGLDPDAVKMVADKLGYDVSVSAKGKYSIGMGFRSPFGKLRYIDVACTGEKYWISVEDGKCHDKWCMPRDEVYKDRADNFLIDVLLTLQEEDASIIGAVNLCLGVDGLASIGHTKDVLAKRRAHRTPNHLGTI